MIALVVAVQFLVAPGMQADTAASEIEAMGAIEAIGAIGAIGAVPITEVVRALPSLPPHSRPLAPEGDAWLGPDKFKHAAMSYAITAYTFAATDSEPAAVASAAIAGILKEIYDRRRGYAFSLRDLVWDAAGVALGYAVVKQTR
jgi:uncharacterized protein YfiM (DUF2279 family)